MRVLPALTDTLMRQIRAFLVRSGVPPLLVLWDVDYTLVATGRVGAHLYEVVLAELYGLGMPDGLGSMGGRTDTSIAIEVLAAARDRPRTRPRGHGARVRPDTARRR
jgi:hypothetical protein